MKKISLLFILVLVFFSCKKTKLEGDFAKYEGTWKSETTTLLLNVNGRASYNYSSGGVTKSIDNGRLIINGSSLKIKMIASKKYHIDTPPTSEPDTFGNSLTTMVLDGEIFYKY